jgi:hypothetical protein
VALHAAQLQRIRFLMLSIPSRRSALMHGVVWGQRPWANHSRGLKREAPSWGGYPALSVTARLHK